MEVEDEEIPEQATEALFLDYDAEGNLRELTESDLDIPEPSVDSNPTYIDLWVENPVIKNENDPKKRFAEYPIIMKTNHYSFDRPDSIVYRRYSEFVILRELLLHTYYSTEPPELPPKTWFHNFEVVFLHRRRMLLERFLERVLEQPIYLGNPALHQFLQTDTPMKTVKKAFIQIENTSLERNYMNNKRIAEQVQERRGTSIGTPSPRTSPSSSPDSTPPERRVTFNEYILVATSQ